ncbi:MAG: response regulator transcription factor [Candidatus Jacksonbacteria bacterium]|jgi:DNA-binding response OmpR family regulator|nr:response regulator transcription factor [Candidatus Jacksonbacteria bacterium]MBT6301378.1 response regulator transcription factor [Candidatus Jacksonbacteria bacterium]MBT6757067.1 response regulator transcription factor [Candidatus Jacksonbacteria bacterium]MBT6954740.1 response regulator transcription factor [Candidatus Jacksonbacteria bacterium]
MKILIVEDEKKLAEMLKKRLERESFAVDITHDGKSALFLVRTNPYDLVILDLMVPEVSGVEFCETIRKENKELFVIVLSALSQTKDKVRAFEAGVDDYLTKPFSFSELKARILAVTSRRFPQRTEVVRAGPITLDRDRRSAKKGKKEISLTNKEFLLLEYLIRNAGRVVSREDILSNVWDYEFDSFSNIVDVYIRYLRRKIGDELIETVKGAGYRLKNGS